jgi:hypothetical protein
MSSLNYYSFTAKEAWDFANWVECTGLALVEYSVKGVFQNKRSREIVVIEDYCKIALFTEYTIKLDCDHRDLESYLDRPLQWCFDVR